MLEMLELQKEEAVKRLEAYAVNDEVVNYLKNGQVLKSVKGILFSLDEDERKMIEDWESKTGNFVYHVMHNDYTFGECYTFLYVSKYKEEWEAELYDLKSNYPYAYVKNMDAEQCSEYGGIQVMKCHEGLIRIG